VERSGEYERNIQRVRGMLRWPHFHMGHITAAELDFSEFLFQVIAETAEKAAVIVTTKLPFSEWTQVIPNARLCKALIDRVTDRAQVTLGLTTSAA
jgi:IstB-like ATP binding protein